MGNIRIPYYVVKKGRGYWTPTKRMRAEGFAIVRCGPDGPGAWRIAAQWADNWRIFRRGGGRSADLERRPNITRTRSSLPRCIPSVRSVRHLVDIA